MRCESSKRLEKRERGREGLQQRTKEDILIKVTCNFNFFKIKSLADQGIRVGFDRLGTGAIGGRSVKEAGNLRTPKWLSSSLIVFVVYFLERRAAVVSGPLRQSNLVG
jgi:hypothetical protein